jgi:hypothetical protein
MSATLVRDSTNRNMGRTSRKRVNSIVKKETLAKTVVPFSDVFE